MRNIIFIIIFSLVSFFSGYGQVRWLEEIHNFGAFQENDGPVSADMKFINESDAPVIINQVHVTCGCTTPTFSKNAVEPADTGSITVTYNPYGRPGRFEKRIYVDLNTNPSRYSLYIKGSVIGSSSTVKEKYPVEAGPLRLRNSIAPFGEVVQGFSKSYFLEVYNASTDSVQPQWSYVPKFISVGSPSSTVYPGENMAYTFMLASDKIKEYGLTQDSLVMVPDPINNPNATFTIPMTVIVMEDFSKLTPGQLRNSPIVTTSENTLNFGEITLTQKKTITFTLRNTGVDPLIIRRIYSGEEGITATVNPTKIKKDKEAIVTVTLDPNKLTSKTVNARLSIVSNDPVEPITNLRVTGLIEE